MADWLAAPSLQPLGRVKQSMTLHIHSLGKLFKAKVHGRECRKPVAVLIYEDSDRVVAGKRNDLRNNVQE